MNRTMFATVLVLTLTVILSSFAVSAQQTRAVPPNDNFVSATPIKIGKNYKVPDIGAATNETGEPVATCRGDTIANSVWFTFSQPTFSTVFLSTFGTVLATENFENFDTVLAVYELTAPGVFTERACSDDINGIAAAQIVFAPTPGITYYVVAGTFSDSDFLPQSTLKLSSRMLTTRITVPNANFEQPLTGSDWKTKNTGDDQVECTNPAYPASSANCTFRFTGTPGVTSKLVQTIPFPAGFQPRKNAYLASYFHYRVMDALTIGKAKVKFVVSYSDGTPPSVKVVNLTGAAHTPGYVYRQIVQPLKSGKIASIKIVVVFGSQAGSLMFDDVGIYYATDSATRGSGLLPVPSAADEEQGMD